MATKVEDILKKAANDAGLDSFDELPVVAAVIFRDPLGAQTWQLFKPVPIRKEMLVVAMFQDDDVVRVYAWPLATDQDGQKLLPTRYTLRAQGNIPLVSEWMGEDVAHEALEWEIRAMIGVDEDEEPEAETPGASAPEAPAPAAATTNGAPTF